MATGLRTSFARLCRDTRTMLDISQERLAAATGVSRGHIAAIECGRVNPSLEMVERIGDALGLDLHIVGRPPIVVDPPRQRDLVHARCSSYVERRLHGSGWATAREVEVVDGRWRAWIDILAYDPRTATLVIVEVKTRVDDLGALERQIATYERVAARLAEGLGWRSRSTATWVVALASEEVERTLRANRDVLAQAFPLRAAEMRTLLGQSGSPHVGSGSAASRGLALIDPRSRRRDWLIPARMDGRRSAPPYVDYADAARRFAAP